MAKDDELALPGDAEKKKREVSFTRLAVWVIAGGVGAYLVISGFIGVLAKG
ncbi:hypothetical protein OVN20_01580 [Microcella daejeonensis]|uniref:hypothetical protein n=1 Tax=Microcella daejeonensis TaxID=2994971 RepID=UPI00226FC2C3|nr:hypothetical protein [Microcella daejeonensis]WAB84292.1 hypothetical protein OVN20_01580 [Microcella daejeonensis]